MCNKCLGTGMFDVLSSIPCDCMRTPNIKNTLNKIVNFREKAAKEGRHEDALMLFAIQNKLVKKIFEDN
jgi:hypothetical protein